MSGLVYFQGGPFDGHVYESETLLAAEGLSIPITSYVWTSDIKVSEKTGAKAHVWKYKDSQPEDIAGVTPVPEPTIASVPPAPPSPSVETAVPAAMNGAAGPNDPTANVVPAPEPVSVSEEVNTAPPAEPTSAPPAAPVPAATNGALPSGAELLAKRKSLKLGRGDVSAECGLAQSKIASIEAGTGKRVKPEEIQLLADALVSLAAKKNGAQPAGVDASAHA